MISQISGTIEQVLENSLQVGVNGLSYEVQIPTAVMKGLSERLVRDSKVTLVTYHYYQTDPSKSIPILIGFSNRIEKDFFEKFITVSGVGPKAAVRALSMPIPDIAHAIDAADLPFLKSLPGIGEQRAKGTIAKLQGKMGRFGLLQSGPSSINGKGDAPASDEPLREEVVEVLMQLQYRRDEAREMVRKAFTRKPVMANTEEVLNEVYRQKKEQR